MGFGCASTVQGNTDVRFSSRNSVLSKSEDQLSRFKKWESMPDWESGSNDASIITAEDDSHDESQHEMEGKDDGVDHSIEESSGISAGQWASRTWI